MNNKLEKLKILSSSNPTIPIYKKKPISNDELIEIKRLQDIENECWINIGVTVLPSLQQIYNSNKIF